MKKVKFTEDERRIFSEETHNFLENRLWKRHEIDGRIFYIKKGFVFSPMNFLDKPAKKNLPSPLDTIKGIETFFLERGYNRKVESNIAITGQIKDTFLIGAAVQYFRKCFWEDESPINGIYFLPQPVIRMKYADKVGEGSTTSFVNASTIQLQCSFQEHINSLDYWFDLFSELGLYMGDFNLELVSPERYGLGKKGRWKNTDGFSISINYLNLNIGDAGFIKIPTKNQNINVSDIGLGLERILWSLYKTPSYFDLIGPESETRHSRIQLLDSIRSATLLSMSNISEGTQDSYSQFRKFTKIASHYYGLFDSFKLINHYYTFWSEFITPQRDLLSTYYFLDDKISKEVVNETRSL